jgi:hemerythrin
MAPIEWDDSYCVGEPVIDRQHQGLVNLINALEDDAEVGFVLDQLTLYVAEHFQTEEKLMAAKGVPGLDAHKSQHREFEEWLTASKQAYRTGGTGGIALRDNIRSYLNGWLIHHIKGSDQSSFGISPNN